MKRFISLGFVLFLIFIFNTPSAIVQTGPEKGEMKYPLEEGFSLNETEEEVTLQPLKDDGKALFIRLGSTYFDPLKSRPVQKQIVKRISSYPEGETGYYLVQFEGPILKDWKESLRTLGVDIFDYIPDYAFIIRMNSRKEDQVRALAHVRWLGIFQPAFRISQQAVDKMYVKENRTDHERKDQVRLELLRVTVFPGEDLERIIKGIEDQGGQVRDRTATKRKTTLKVEIPADAIGNLPAIEGIKWIEPAPKWKLFNNVSTDIMNARAPRDSHGLYGEGQVVAVCDTGLDRGSIQPASLHDDFEDGSGGSRVLRIFDLVGDGASDVNSGHGTHVAGSILGNGFLSGSTPSANSYPATSFSGLAPRANLIFQAVERNSDKNLSGIPTDLNILFAQAERAGAHLHSNSWGSSMFGIYTSDSEDVDEYMWDHPEFLILFSAGNDGMDLDRDGIIDLYSIGSPATAKNCLTVGASEGDRVSPPNGYNFTYSYYWLNDYPVDPIAGDHLSNDPGGMAAFSSRGPTLDGRYKPDLVAPGTNILSARSAVASGTGWGIYDDYYMWMGGTSMSTPLAAGAAALMREYLINQVGFAEPSAALIKAALLNSAQDIYPGQYGSGVNQEISGYSPNNVEGWGKLDLANGVFPVAPWDVFYLNGVVEDSGLVYDYSNYFTVTDSSQPLKINLVWTDYPGSPIAQDGLVNDLDLEIIGPGGVQYFPDNALKKSKINMLSYDDGSPEVYFNMRKTAVKFLPPSGSFSLESVTFGFYNYYSNPIDVDLVVYDVEGGTGLPGTERYRKTLNYMPDGVSTSCVSGVIVSGEFFVALEKNSTALDRHGVDQDDSDHGDLRSYYDDGSGWVQDAGYTSYIRANIRGTDFSINNDRVNNAVGLTIDNPPLGSYDIYVAGENVPQEPQPFSLVINGAIASPGIIQFSSDSYTISESAVTAVITATRINGRAGAASVEYATNNGTALESGATDYFQANGTLDWADGEAGIKSFEVIVVDDARVEGNETINLDLNFASGVAGVVLGSPNTAVLSITDNDTSSVDGGGGGGGGGGGCFITTISYGIEKYLALILPLVFLMIGMGARILRK